MNRRLVFTAYNRPHYFAQVMDAWARVRGFGDWNPLVLLEPSAECQQMAGIAEAAGAAVARNPRRYGVLSNPWHALEAAFSGGADFAVLAEDDVLVSDDILEYFSWASTTLREQHILAVCAASFAEAITPGQEHQAVPTTQFCPLIWGTWSDRWATALRESWDHDYTSGTPTQPQAGWDWNINLRVMGDWHVVQPWASRSDHIGRLMGTHTTEFSFPASRAATFTAHRPPGSFLLVR